MSSSVMSSSGAECVDAGVVDEDVETTVVLDCGVDNTLRLARLRDITLDSDGLAAGLLDGVDSGIGARFARGVVDDDGGAFRREGFGNGGSDSLGCAGHDGDFILELFVHKFVCLVYYSAELMNY